jgi:hypothetical protein
MSGNFDAPVIVGKGVDLARSNFHFLDPGLMHSKDAILRTMKSWKTVRVKNSDASAKDVYVTGM